RGIGIMARMRGICGCVGRHEHLLEHDPGKLGSGFPKKPCSKQNGVKASYPARAVLSRRSAITLECFAASMTRQQRFIPRRASHPPLLASAKAFGQLVSGGSAQRKRAG